jgi:hypothetical protein
MKVKLLYGLIVTFVVLSALIASSILSNPVVGQEEPVSMDRLAREIRAGKVDVGEEYGMAREQRFHVIHADTLGMKCLQCHVEEAPYEIGALLYDEEQGPSDRRVCLGCHLTGPGFKMYEPKE